MTACCCRLTQPEKTRRKKASGEIIAGLLNCAVVLRPAMTIDLLPTLIELCGLERPHALAVDGTSLVPLLESDNQAWPDRTLFVQSHRIDHPKPWRVSAVMTVPSGSVTLRLVISTGASVWLPQAEQPKATAEMRNARIR